MTGSRHPPAPRTVLRRQRLADTHTEEQTYRATALLQRTNEESVQQQLAHAQKCTCAISGVTWGPFQYYNKQILGPICSLNFIVMLNSDSEYMETVNIMTRQGDVVVVLVRTTFFVQPLNDAL